MNEKFYSLPEEKQLKIINAAMEVFGQNEYKRASTDLMLICPHRNLRIGWTS
jgi:TetR/AcrR family transcriptional regulator